MNLRNLRLFEGVPRIVLLAGIPVVAFIVSIGLTLATSTGGSSSGVPTAVPFSIQKALPTSTPAVVVTPTATPAPYRTNCGQINGTAYQSSDERDWFVQNCNGSQPKTTTTTGGGGAPTVSRQAIETSLGDRLVIQKAGVNAPVSRTAVQSDGTMPDPTGYFNAVLYDFSSFQGLGGAPGAGGNAVFAGHVDCAACGPGGSPGAAVFYYVRNLAPGDTIEYYTQAGAYIQYVVTYVADLPPDADWGGIVSAGRADLTLITCSGVFQAAVHEYTTRRVVQARKA